MSKRAAEILRDDMEARGPVKLAEVEAAQKEIVASRSAWPRKARSASAARGGGDYV